MTKNVVRRLRETHHINRRVTQSMFRAIDYAATIQRPLNTYVVINLREHSATAAATLFTAIRRKCRVWLSYKVRAGKTAPHPPAYVYALENPSGIPHVNWLLHVPPELRAEFERKLPRWVGGAQGAIGPFDVRCTSVVARYVKRLGKYIVKGTDPKFVGHFHLEGVHVPQGKVWGKRAGTSISLGATVRREAGFRPLRRRYAG